MGPPMDEAAYVRRAIGGDMGAFRCLVEAFHRRVYRLAYGLLQHHQDAEDATQETFLRAYRSLGRFDTSRPLANWLLTIAANCCKSMLQRRSRRPLPVEGLEQVETACPSTPDSRELARELRRALATLRTDYRLVFLMYHDHSLSYADIARAIRRPEGTVKTWLHRARADLMAELQRRGMIPTSGGSDGLPAGEGTGRTVS